MENSFNRSNVRFSMNEGIFEHLFVDLGYQEQAEIFNNFAEKEGFDERIYPIYMMDEVFKSLTPFELFKVVSNKNFCREPQHFKGFFVYTKKHGFETFENPYEYITGLPYANILGWIFLDFECWAKYKKYLTF